MISLHECVGIANVRCHIIQMIWWCNVKIARIGMCSLTVNVNVDSWHCILAIYYQIFIMLKTVKLISVSLLLFMLSIRGRGKWISEIDILRAFSLMKTCWTHRIMQNVSWLIIDWLGSDPWSQCCKPQSRLPLSVSRSGKIINHYGKLCLQMDRNQVYMHAQPR